MTQYTLEQEAAIVRWYDFEAPEELLREMEEVHNRSFTPREAYELYHSSSVPAQESQSESIAAPVAAVQGQGTRSKEFDILEWAFSSTFKTVFFVAFSVFLGLVFAYFVGNGLDGLVIPLGVA